MPIIGIARLNEPAIIRRCRDQLTTCNQLILICRSGPGVRDTPPSRGKHWIL